MTEFFIKWVFVAYVASIVTMILSNKEMILSNKGMDVKHFVFWFLSPALLFVFLVMGFVRKQIKQSMKAFIKALFPF